MSSTLVWRPIYPIATPSLPDELKFILQKAFSDPVNKIFNTEHLQYLTGLRDAGVKGAEELIKAIAENGEIKVEEQF